MEEKENLLMRKDKVDKYYFFLVIGRCELDEMATFFEASRKIVKILGTTFGYLIEETDQENMYKTPKCLKVSV